MLLLILFHIVMTRTMIIDITMVLVSMIIMTVMIITIIIVIVIIILQLLLKSWVAERRLKTTQPWRCDHMHLSSWRCEAKLSRASKSRGLAPLLNIYWDECLQSHHNPKTNFHAKFFLTISSNISNKKAVSPLTKQSRNLAGTRSAWRGGWNLPSLRPLQASVWGFGA